MVWDHLHIVAYGKTNLGLQVPSQTKLVVSDVKGTPQHNQDLTLRDMERKIEAVLAVTEITRTSTKSLCPSHFTGIASNLLYQ